MGNGQRKRPGGASQVGSASSSLPGIAPGKGSRSQARYANVQRKEEKGAEEQAGQSEEHPQAAASSDDYMARQIVGQLEFLYDCIGAGVDLAIGALDRDDKKAPASGGVVVTLLSAAMNVVLGDMTKAVGGLIGGMSGGAAGATLNKAVTLAIDTATASESDTAAGLPLMGAFADIQKHKLLVGKGTFKASTAGLMRALVPLPAGVLKGVSAGLLAAVESKELTKGAKLRTMTEWMNFNARQSHGADEGSDSNVSLGGVMGEHLLDPSLSGKAANKNMKGLMRIKCRTRLHGDMEDGSSVPDLLQVTSIKLVGMHSAVKTEFLRGYEVVRDVPVNKIVELYPWFSSNDPTPLGSALIGADGQVKWAEADTGRGDIDMRKIAADVWSSPLSKIS